MSILINGLTMPTGNEVITIRPDGMAQKSLRAEFGKAIELPPHGRLIDGDLLPWQLANYPFKCASYDDWEKLCDGIAKAPTVIEAEGKT